MRLSILILILFSISHQSKGQNTYDTFATAFGRTVTNVTTFITRDNINALDEGEGQEPTCGPPFGYYDVFDSLRVNSNDLTVVLNFQAQNIDPEIILAIQVLDENKSQISGGCFQIVNGNSINVTIQPNLKYYVRYHDVGGNDEGTFDISISTDATLPVNWSRNIEAKQVNESIFINWSVAQQINNEKFVIEYSRDSKNFVKIGKEMGEVNFSEEKDYHYIDHSPTLGSNYYRVKQVDLDGTYEYSNIAYVDYQPTDQSQISIYPNPVYNNLSITSSYKSNVIIYNHFGSIVKQIELKEGNNVVDMSGFIEGFYIFRTENGMVVKVMKL